MANLNLSEFTEKTFVADADWTFVWDTAGAISKKVSRNNWLNSGTLAGASAPITVSQTWNDAAVAFTAFKVNATSTNSASGSLLLDLQVGGSPKFNVSKTAVATLSVAGGVDNSALYFGGANYSVSLTRGATSLDAGVNGDNRISFNVGGGYILLSGRSALAWSDGVATNTGTIDTYLYRDAANTLALRNGAAAQTFNVYGTYTSGTSYERLTLSAPTAGNAIIGTNRGSGSNTARGLNFQTDGANRWFITSVGDIGAASDNTYDIGASGTNRPRNLYVGSNVISRPAASITPANNSELVVEATSNTTLTFKLKGTDGTVRSAMLVLA